MMYLYGIHIDTHIIRRKAQKALWYMVVHRKLQMLFRKSGTVIFPATHTHTQQF